MSAIAKDIVNTQLAFERLEETLWAWESEYSANKRPLRVLEAGGGSLSHVTFRSPADVTVVDKSPEQLELNQVATRKILGDLHTVELEDKYDCVVCWDVIEHLDNPSVVMRKLFEAVTPGGLVILAAPNRTSLPGAITTYTPHWFHLAVMRYVFKNKNAGKPGYPPFQAVHHRDIAPTRIEMLANELGMDVMMFQLYEETLRRNALRKKSPLASAGYGLTMKVGEALLRRPLNASDMIVVLQRGAAS